MVPDRMGRNDEDQIEERPGYHFMTDMTNQAIAWVQSEKSLTPQKPFFIYGDNGASAEGDMNGLFNDHNQRCQGA
jgi:arylsulfatase A-like enzyme